MLQIISGKFFTSDAIREEQCDAILYSNMSYVAPIETVIGELRPVDSYRTRVASYVFRYTSRYEPVQPKDVLFMPTSDEAVEQYRLLLSFYYQAFFHYDRSYVESLCRTKASHGFDRNVPMSYVPRYFDLPLDGTQGESDEFAAFIQQVLGMPRTQYRLLISCLSSYLNALETVGNNFDLAYSILVYVLEALSHSIERRQLVWEEYDQNTRDRIDKLLVSVEPQLAGEIRAVLLSNPHQRLKKTFLEFINSHLRDEFFTSEACKQGTAIPRSELIRTLSNLYNARSSYVHGLKSVLEHLRLNWIGREHDIFHWDHEPHITFAGLVRLTHHVITTFVARQQVSKYEKYEWRREIPGVIQVKLAPQYWVCKTENFQPSHARMRLSGFIEHYVSQEDSTRNLLDMRPLMESIESVLPTAKSSERHPLLALYWMFNGMIPEEHRRLEWLGVLDKWRFDTDQCTIELMAIYALWDNAFPWSASDCSLAFETYQRSRYKATATRLPRQVEIAIMVSIACLFYTNSQMEQYTNWMSKGIEDAAGNSSIQEHLRECLEECKLPDMHRIINRPGNTNKHGEPTTSRDNDVN